MENQTILHIANYAAPYKGNFIASLETLEKQLKLNGNNRMVYVFPEECKSVKWIDSFIKKRNVVFVPSPIKKCKMFLDRRLIFILKNIFEQEKPAIIHSHFDGYDEYVVKANFIDAQVVWHHHNPRTLVQNSLKQLYQRYVLYHQYHVLGKKAHIIILGKSFQEELNRFGYEKEAFLLPNGIEEERIHYKKKENSKPISFLNFGGRADHTGLDILVEAIKLLKKKNLNFKVKITDGVDTRNVIHQYFGDIIPNEIEIIPQTENIELYFHENDWFISASRRETFSYAVAEAMLSGTPILSSDIEGVSWAFKEPSVITFENKNSTELATKMEEIILGGIVISEEALKESYQFILDNYTAKAWAKKLMMYYDMIVS